VKLRAMRHCAELLWRGRIWGPARFDRHPSFYMSHAQFGEDMILRHLVGEKRRGFYVDIGAHHPFYFSNTFWFYRRGWRGLNVDALPGAMSAFNALRPRDINVEACLARTDGEIVQFNIPTQAAEASCKSPTQSTYHSIEMRTRSLASLLAEFMPRGIEIDFMSVDCEGLDEDILRGNDWERFKPNYLLVESEAAFEVFGSCNLGAYLESLGYAPLGKSGLSYILGLR
jgi:FkbM family methyltransferase